MAIAAHTPGGYGGVPQSVGREFNEADTGRNLKKLPLRKAPMSQRQATAAIRKKGPRMGY